MLPEAREVAFLTADVPTQHKEVERLKRMAEAEGLGLKTELAADFEAWKAAFDRVQENALVILGNPSGITGWDEAAAGAWMRDHTRSSAGRVSHHPAPSAPTSASTAHPQRRRKHRLPDITLRPAVSGGG